MFVVQSLSCVWLCDPMDCSTPGFPDLNHLLEFAQTHVHWANDSIQSSHLNQIISGGLKWEKALGNVSSASHSRHWRQIRPRVFPWLWTSLLLWSFSPGGSDSKKSVSNAGDPDLIPGWRRYPGEGNGNLLLYSWLENSMNREAWWATVYWVVELDTTEWITLSISSLFVSGFVFFFLNLYLSVFSDDLKKKILLRCPLKRYLDSSVPAFIFPKCFFFSKDLFWCG